MTDAVADRSAETIAGVVVTVDLAAVMVVSERSQTRLRYSRGGSGNCNCSDLQQFISPGERARTGADLLVTLSSD